MNGAVSIDYVLDALRSLGISYDSGLSETEREAMATEAEKTPDIVPVADVTVYTDMEENGFRGDSSGTVLTAVIIAAVVLGCLAIAMPSDIHRGRLAATPCRKRERPLLTL